MSEPTRRAGRPRTYTRKVADAILLDIAEGEHSLRHACASHGVPPGTFCGWVVDDIDGIAERYMRARKIRAHGLADEIIEIADFKGDDFVETERGVAFNREAVQRSALKVDARKWLLSKMLRDEFGEKVQHSGEIGLDITGATDSLVAKLGGGPAKERAPGETEGGG